MKITLPIKPMLAELSAPPTQANDGTWAYPKVMDDEDYGFEIKWDGHRIIAARPVSDVVLYARSGRYVTDEYPEIARWLDGVLKPGTIIDGEVVALVNGTSQLQALAGRGTKSQMWRDANLRYFAFDILQNEGSDTRNYSFEERKAMLEEAIGEHERILISDHVTDGREMWKLVTQYGLEGLIAKPLTSRYIEGERGTWLKLKRNSRSNFDVVGFTAGDKARADTFGALILAEQDGAGSRRFAGKCGTGFTSNGLKQLRLVMDPIARDEPTPFLDAKQVALIKVAAAGQEITWLNGGLVVEVEYAERSDDQIVRFPSYKGVVETPPWAPPPAASSSATPAARTGILPPAPPRPTGVAIGTPGGATIKPKPGDVFTAPGSTGIRTIVVKGDPGGAKYLACECPAARFAWKGTSFKACKHVRYVLENDLKGLVLVDGKFA